MQPPAADLDFLVLHGKGAEPILPSAHVTVFRLTHGITKDLVQRRHAWCKLRSGSLRSPLNLGTSRRLACLAMLLSRLALTLAFTLRLVSPFDKTLAH